LSSPRIVGTTFAMGSLTRVPLGVEHDAMGRSANRSYNPHTSRIPGTVLVTVVACTVCTVCVSVRRPLVIWTVLGAGVTVVGLTDDTAVLVDEGTVVVKTEVLVCVMLKIGVIWLVIVAVVVTVVVCCGPTDSSKSRS